MPNTLKTKRWNVLFIGVLFFLSACSEPNKQHPTELLVQVSTLESRLQDDATSGETSREISTPILGEIPSEIDFIKVHVLDDQAQLLASRSVSDTEVSFRMQIPDGIPLEIIAQAYSGDELLYSGQLLVEPVARGSANNVSITLLSNIDVIIRSTTLAIQANEQIDFSQLVQVTGLNDPSFHYAVEGIAGGSEGFGFISDSGLYTPPPHILESLSVEISASPNAAPSFGEVIQVTIIPSLIDLNWFANNPGLKACVVNQGVALVALLSTLSCLPPSTDTPGIISLDGLEKLTALETVDVSLHNINTIPPLNTLSLLTDLNLSDNSLGDIEELGKLTTLHFLDLSGNISLPVVNVDNPLAPLTPLANLTQLQILDVSCTNAKEASVTALREALPNTQISSICLR
ncbi:MAG: hypothetical protein JKY01_02315 [Pseudomonadales bacterium]|nr:hypothetical protein [Pseudomonadales bacterium]